MKLLKSAIALTMVLAPFACPLDTFSWTALTYQEAVQMCVTGDSHACMVVRRYEAGDRGSYEDGGGSPADGWVSPEEVRGEKPGVFSPGELAR